MSVTVLVTKKKEEDYCMGSCCDYSEPLHKVITADTLEQALSQAATIAYRFPKGSWDSRPRVFVIAEELTNSEQWKGLVAARKEQEAEKQRKIEAEKTRAGVLKAKKDRLGRLQAQLAGLLDPREVIERVGADIAALEAEIEAEPPVQEFNVHTEHCCAEHKACKYGDKDCPVATGHLPTSYPCNCNW
jgi:cell fate (sporulation/competence/biofilm development) regulator YmcA (YheA/YmcA/DUF963 family)